jgi:hypothetical protein
VSNERPTTPSEGPIRPLPRRPKPNDRVFVVMLVIFALAAAAWLLADKFAAMSRIQDCVMSGRKNCVQVDDPNPR